MRPSICLLKIFMKNGRRLVAFCSTDHSQRPLRRLDARYASTSELIVDLEALLTAEEVKDLQLTRIQTPDMKGTNLEQLKRVWEKYTSEVRNQTIRTPIHQKTMIRRSHGRWRPQHPYKKLGTTVRWCLQSKSKRESKLITAATAS